MSILYNIAVMRDNSRSEIQPCWGSFVALSLAYVHCHPFTLETFVCQPSSNQATQYRAFDVAQAGMALPPSFANSFWTADFSLEPLLDKLEAGTYENQELLRFIGVRVAGLQDGVSDCY